MELNDLTIASLRKKLVEPLAGTLADSRRGCGIGQAQRVHADTQALGIERVDSESSVAALRTAGPAGEPVPRPPSDIGQRGVHDLHKFSVTGGKWH